MSQFDLLIKNGKLVIPRCGIIQGSIGVKDEKVAAILSPSEEASAKKEIDVGGKYVLPGIIDPHSHPGYPGGAFDEAFDTESASAAVGGVTTNIHFYRQYGQQPSPYEDFWEVMGKAEERSHVDFGVHLMISTWAQVAPGEYKKYADEYGVRSFKYSMAYKGAEGKALGITNDVDDAFLYDSFAQLSKIPGGTITVHCENMEILTMLTAPLKEQGRTDLAAWDEGRPDLCEAESGRRVLYLAELNNCPVYIVHVTCKAAMEEIIRHRERKTPPIYAETCTHYLTQTKNSAGIFGKVNPPLRSQEDADFLWQEIASGGIDTVGTDHCHLMKSQKKDLWSAVPGFPGVALLLPLLLSEGVNKGRISLEKVAEVASYNAAKIFGLYPKKGTIQVGSDADFAIVDLNSEKTVNPEMLLSKSDFSLWDGWKLKGWPVMTVLRGEVIMENGKVIGKEGYGKYVGRW